MYREGWPERVARASELRLTLLERARNAAKRRLHAHRAGLLEPLARLERLEAAPTPETLDPFMAACGEADVALGRFESERVRDASPSDFVLLEAEPRALLPWPMEASALVVGTGIIELHDKKVIAAALRENASKMVEGFADVRAISRLDGLRLFFHRDVEAEKIPFRLDVRVELDDQGTAYVISNLMCPVRWSKRARIRPQTMGDDLVGLVFPHEPRFDHEAFDVTYYVEGDEGMLREMLVPRLRDALLSAAKTDVVDVVFERGIATMAVGDVRTVASTCALLGRFALA